MCGIIGAISTKDVIPDLIDGLKHLAYRGYDSAGIAIIDEGLLRRVRTSGKIQELERKLAAHSIEGCIGIAHTRWATHGSPSEVNAHPHFAGDKIAIVHNGIIENNQTLRAFLLEKGCKIESETDSELIAHLLYLNLSSHQSFLSAIRKTLTQLSGTYALGILYSKEPNHLYAVRKSSPLAIGLNEKNKYIASDTLALASMANHVIYLDDGDIADITLDAVKIYDAEDKLVEREVHVKQQTKSVVTKDNFPHFMLKEIFEQPEVVSELLHECIQDNVVNPSVFGHDAQAIFERINRVQIVACGTSFHAGLVGRNWLEELAGIPCQVEIASENRYRKGVIEPNTLFVVLSQSGETADTLSALRLAKAHYTATLAICNVAESSIAREADLVLITKAGPEIGVASTKAFTTQLVSLFFLAILLGHNRSFNKNFEPKLMEALHHLPNLLEKVLQLNERIKEAAQPFSDKHHAIYLARGIQFPIAMEGALKLKEISYIHAEAFPAGELKHGPLALVDENIPVVVLAPFTPLLDKLKSNLQEVKARGGRLLIFTDKESDIHKDHQDDIILMPSVNPYLAPIVYALPMQLLAYHVAVLKGTDLDQPRNLAKSVTVE